MYEKWGGCMPPNAPRQEFLRKDDFLPVALFITTAAVPEYCRPGSNQPFLPQVIHVRLDQREFPFQGDYKLSDIVMIVPG